MGILLGCRSLGQNGHYLDIRRLCFLVGGDYEISFVVSRDFEERTGFRIFNGGNTGKNVFDALFHPLYVEVAYDGDRFQIGPVPFVIKILDGLVVEILNDVQRSDDIADGIFRIFEHHGKELLLHPESGITAGSPFFRDNSSFAIDFVID